jgi:hypothetical protein
MQLNLASSDPASVATDQVSEPTVTATHLKSPPSPPLKTRDILPSDQFFASLSGINDVSKRNTSKRNSDLRTKSDDPSKMSTVIVEEVDSRSQYGYFKRNVPSSQNKVVDLKNDELSEKSLNLDIVSQEYSKRRGKRGNTSLDL